MEPLIGASRPDAPAILDSDTAHFAADVIDASRDVPVIVDFWAPWCEPCKQLGPALEKVVTEAAGRVRLVKINVDENQGLAQQLRVQSIPAVFAFKDGQPADGFAGALPESQVRQFVTRLIGEIGPTPVQQALERAREALDSGQNGGASALYEQVLQHEPGNTEAAAGLSRCYLADGEFEGARAVLDAVAEKDAGHADIVGARAALALAEQAKEAGAGVDTAALGERLASNANDHEARLELATALFAGGDREGAVEALLETIRRDAKWNDAAARKQLLQYFEAFGPTDPLTTEGRRRLSSILFS